MSQEWRYLTFWIVIMLAINAMIGAFTNASGPFGFFLGGSAVIIGAGIAGWRVEQMSDEW